jgi:hypothetical protein
LIYSYGCVISTVALLSCGKIIPFFLTDPQTKLGAVRDGICHSYNRGRPCPLRPNCPYTHRCDRIGCGGNHPGYQCPQSRGENDHNAGKMINLHNPPVAPRRPTENRTVSLKSSIYNSSNSIPLDNTIVTPIRVDALEDALCGHPDSSFVLKLCSDLRFGARLGYDGPRMYKFSKVCH